MTDADHPPIPAAPTDGNSPNLASREKADTPDIFVSYAREDRAFVARLVDALKTAGHRVWWDSELKSGPYEPVIRNLLRSVKCVVVVWSEAAARSEWVQAEADIGRERKVLVQALRCKPASVPIPFNRHNYVDFGRAQSPSDPALTMLLAHIHALISDNPPPPSLEELAWWQIWLQRRRWLLAGLVAAFALAALAWAYVGFYNPTSCDPQSGFCVYADCFLHDPSTRIRLGMSFEACRTSCIAEGDRCHAFSHAPDDRGGSCMLSMSYDDIRARRGSRIGVVASLKQPTVQQLAVCDRKP